MKSWLIALIAAAGCFSMGIVASIEALIFLPMPEPAPGSSIGWDPISFVHQSGLQVLIISVSIAVTTFAIVNRYFLRYPLPRN